jgi:tetratricopeptide (TPR) repeat protein
MRTLDGTLPVAGGDAKPLRHARRHARSLVFAASSSAFVLLAVGCSSNAKPTPPASGVTSATTAAVTSAQKLLNDGIQAETQGNLDQAKQDYVGVLAADPTNKYAYYDLGVIYQQQGDVTDASTSYQKALLIDSNYKPALFNLAVLDTPIAPQTAITTYETLLRLNPDDPNVLLNLGLLLKQAGQAAEGEADIAKAIKISPPLASRLGSTTTTTK